MYNFVINLLLSTEKIRNKFVSEISRFFETLVKISMFNNKCRIITLNGKTRAIKHLHNGRVKYDTHFYVLNKKRHDSFSGYYNIISTYKFSIHVLKASDLSHRMNTTATYFWSFLSNSQNALDCEHGISSSSLIFSSFPFALPLL